MYRDVADVEWVREHIARHDVTLDEVRAVLFRHRNVREPGKGSTSYIYGRTDAGRYLFVLVTPSRRDPTLAFTITSRDMDDDEKRRHRKRLRR